MPTEKARRPMIPLIATGILAMLLAAPTGAQGSDETTIQGLRSCAQIDDRSDRTACYDSYLRPDARGGARAAAPLSSAPVAAAGQAAPRQETAVRTRTPSRTPSRSASTGTVAASVQRAPGVYLLTMKDGAQWQFTSTVRASYDPPGSGATVEIKPGALGSYLLSYNDQSVVRVTRVR